MDISGVMTPAANQASQANRQRPNDATNSVVQDKPANEATAAKVANDVVSETQQIPTEKLPPNLGRNIDVTA